jgi:aminocarboxymuconate-semialdehyde decarboxylase
MSPLIDVHCHVTPKSFPACPDISVSNRWPCMQCFDKDKAKIFMGDSHFRDLDDRSWNAARRVEDMGRDGVSLQVLSAMPELLSYWMPSNKGQIICDHSNAFLADMVARDRKHFRGFGLVPLQDPESAAKGLSDIINKFGLSGVEVGSNVNGRMLGDSFFNPFWEAAEDLELAVFVHALHPVAVKSINATPIFTNMVGFPVDVAMAVSSLIISGTLERYPRLKIGFSHGGGGLGSMLGRLDKGWEISDGYGGSCFKKPSEQAKGLFLDSNVYDPIYLGHLENIVSPGHIFAGSDYPYSLMQESLSDYIGSAKFNASSLMDVRYKAAEAFLGEIIYS